MRSIRIRQPSPTWERKSPWMDAGSLHSLPLWLWSSFSYGCVALKWSFPNITAAYIIFMIILAIVFRVGPTEMCNRFTAGAARVLGPALAIGFANGVMVLLNEANIMDTLVYYMGNALQGKSPWLPCSSSTSSLPP